MQAVEYYSVLKNKWTIKLWGLMDETYVHITKWKKKLLKRLSTIWFQLYDVMEKAKL